MSLPCSQLTKKITDLYSECRAPQVGTVPLAAAQPATKGNADGLPRLARQAVSQLKEDPGGAGAWGKLWPKIEFTPISRAQLTGRVWIGVLVAVFLCLVALALRWLYRYRASRRKAA